MLLLAYEFIMSFIHCESLNEKKLQFVCVRHVEFDPKWMLTILLPSETHDD